MVRTGVSCDLKWQKYFLNAQKHLNSSNCAKNAFSNVYPANQPGTQNLTSSFLPWLQVVVAILKMLFLHTFKPTNGHLRKRMTCDLYV